jgi:hypothetical protein
MTFPIRPSKRSIAARLAFYGNTEMPAPVVRKKRGKQKESMVTKAAQQEAKLAFNAVLMRNRRGMTEMRGHKIPFGVGPNGTGDVLGWTPIRISQAMVGAVLPIYTETEQKLVDGVVAPHQQQRIEYLRDLNAICGVIREGGDFTAIVRKWMERWA